MDAVLKDLFLQGAHSDLTVTCGQVSFKLHKAIVCARSEWFANACKTGVWKEENENVINLPQAETESVIEKYYTDTTGRGIDCDWNDDSTDEPNEQDLTKDDPRAVFSMFEFMYLSKYATLAGPLIPEPSRAAHDLRLHALVYSLGDKYGVNGLKSDAVRMFNNAASSQTRLNKGMFIRCATITFASTPDNDVGLRDAVVEHLHRGSVSLASDSGIDTAVRSIDGLAYRAWKRTLKAQCNRCGHPAHA